ncbi:MAG: class I tRNA ligase family protein, partial [Oscillospiraceae bacterium]
FAAQWENLAFQTALMVIFTVFSRANKYIDETAPWALGKDPAEADRLAAVIYNLLEVIRVCARLLTPFMPETCEKIFAQLGCPEDECSYDKAIYFANTSYFVVKKENLFPRIDLKKELAELEAAEAAAKAEPAVAATPAVEASPAKVEKAAEPLPEGIISIEEFMNVRLLAAKVLDCEP